MNISWMPGCWQLPSNWEVIPSPNQLLARRCHEPQLNEKKGEVMLLLILPKYCNGHIWTMTGHVCMSFLQCRPAGYKVSNIQASHLTDSKADRREAAMSAMLTFTDMTEVWIHTTPQWRGDCCKNNQRGLNIRYRCPLWTYTEGRRVRFYTFQSLLNRKSEWDKWGKKNGPEEGCDTNKYHWP